MTDPAIDLAAGLAALGMDPKEAAFYAERKSAFVAQIPYYWRDQAFRAVDACGGTYTSEEEASGYAAGHKAALDAACDALMAMGAVDPVQRQADMLTALKAIAGGDFPGASNLAGGGDWHGFVDALQAVARDAVEAVGAA